MNSPTIAMPKEDARRKLAAYEAAARANPRAHTETDKRIAEGYRVLAKGGRLVDVNEALKAGGLNLAGIPKLAIARAHRVSVDWMPRMDGRYEMREGKSIYVPFATGGGIYDYAPRNSRLDDDRVKWIVGNDTFDRDKVQLRGGRTFRALVPFIPAPHKPRLKLENYFILWEASWHSVPRDPYLLRPLSGTLMEIVAEWDLTDLEVSAVRAGLRRE